MSASTPMATDFSNSVKLDVLPAPQLPTAPGYATQLLLIVGKYLAADAANHSNGLVDPTTAQMLTSFDFDGLATNVVTTLTAMDPTTLPELDSLAAGTLLTAYGYDITTGTFVQGGSRELSRSHTHRKQAYIHRTATRRMDVTDPAFQDLAHSIADYARSLGSGLAKAGKIIGITAAVVGLVVESPAIIAVGGAAALMGYIGTASGTALGFGFDTAAAAADNSASPEDNYKTAMKSLQYFASNTLASIIDATVNPADGLVNEYLQKNLSVEAYSAYASAGTFVFANSDSLSEKLVGYEQTVAASDPATPPIDKAVLNADIQATASTAAADAIDSVNANVPTVAGSGADLTSLSNQLLDIASVIQILSTSPGNQYEAAIETFGTCSTPFDNDILAIANEVAASGNVTDAQIAQLTSDVQGIVTCGSALTQALGQSASSASNTQTGTSGSDSITVDASNCNSKGCWITETTNHADGTSSTETGYVSCKSDGFCPLYLH
jgi:hypothetical protein